ncbi:peptidoglycan editing factor PgeF [bacterium]|nr:peptidoglycan editing factor PgeF [bacterium]
MFFEKRHGLFVGRFPAWARTPGLRHAFSTRRGGVSRPPFGTLNLGLNTEDDPDSVRENWVKFCVAAELDRDRAAFARQDHGDAVAVVETARVYEDSDALVTQSTDVVLFIQVADCVPVFLFDPERRAVGLAHAGWRGSAKDIAGKTAAAMTARFGSDPGRMSACIGPSIGPCCCEVGPDAAERFSPRYLQGSRLDLRAVNRDALIAAGMAPDAIHISRLCTVCHKDWFFSHRGDGGKTGRMAAMIGLEKTD